jgi:hypothetical protein
MASTLMLAIEQLRKEVKELADSIKGDPRISELLRRITALNTLEELESQDKTSLGGLLDFGAIAPVNHYTPAVTIEPDEFYRKDALEAAKLFLRKKGRPASLREIMDGIRSGGGNPGPEATLRTSLTRSTYQIAKVSEDFFGLVEFYEAKRGRRKKNEGDEIGLKDSAQLEVKDADGNVVRHVSSAPEDAVHVSEEEETSDENAPNA